MRTREDFLVTWSFHESVCSAHCGSLAVRSPRTIVFFLQGQGSSCRFGTLQVRKGAFRFALWWIHGNHRGNGVSAFSASHRSVSSLMRCSRQCAICVVLCWRLWMCYLLSAFDEVKIQAPTVPRKNLLCRGTLQAVGGGGNQIFQKLKRWQNPAPNT